MLRESWRTRQGKRFEAEIRKSLAHLMQADRNIYFHRLMDHKDFYVLNPHLRGIRQPDDFLVVAYGIPIVVECKSSQAPRFPLNNVRPHQVESLTRFEAAGGKSWILIQHRRYKVMRKRNRVFALRIQTWLDICSIAMREKRKSATWDMIEANADRELKKSKGLWNLYPILSYIIR